MTNYVTLDGNVLVDEMLEPERQKPGREIRANLIELAQPQQLLIRNGTPGRETTSNAGHPHSLHPSWVTHGAWSGVCSSRSCDSVESSTSVPDCRSSRADLQLLTDGSNHLCLNLTAGRLRFQDKYIDAVISYYSPKFIDHGLDSFSAVSTSSNSLPI